MKLTWKPCKMCKSFFFWLVFFIIFSLWTLWSVFVWNGHYSTFCKLANKNLFWNSAVVLALFGPGWVKGCFCVCFCCASISNISLNERKIQSLLD